MKNSKSRITRIEFQNREKKIGNSQVRHVSSTKQISDLPRVREKISGGSSIALVRLIEEPELRLGGAKEDWKRWQRQAGSNLGVYSIGQADAAVAGGRGRGRSKRRQTHGEESRRECDPQRKSMKSGKVEEREIEVELRSGS